MTIKERFARYSNEELREGISMVEKRAAENKAAMERYKSERNLEFFRYAKELYDRDMEILLDAQCALDARN